jgi:hypothetical protein
MTRWQHLYFHEYTNMQNLFEMAKWCEQRHGPPLALPNWIVQKLRASGSNEIEAIGGWTRDWRRSGYSFWHVNPHFWEQMRQEPRMWRNNYLEICPLHVLFYSSEDLSEFKLVWG